MQWFAQAPSNIALIKYMGKKDAESNLPANPSLSYTLNNLLTSVMLEHHSGKKDFWEPLHNPGVMNFNLPLPAQLRYLDHLTRIKNHFNYSGGFIVRSSNNFPHSSGLASSASSFAALTKCACIALSELTGKPLPSVEEQAQLSRLGSGSSCRSFFAPWALWDQDIVKPITLPYPQLEHHVILISQAEKEVSSREAHARIVTSAAYADRPNRARQNLKVLLQALEHKNWQDIFQVCWREFQDLHLLFSTSKPAFTYFNEHTQSLLTLLQKVWERDGDGPLVTMDAGPNIHLLYRPNQENQFMKFKHDHLLGNYDVL